MLVCWECPMCWGKKGAMDQSKWLLQKKKKKVSSPQLINRINNRYPHQMGYIYTPYSPLLHQPRLKIMMDTFGTIISPATNEKAQRAHRRAQFFLFGWKGKWILLFFWFTMCCCPNMFPIAPHHILDTFAKVELSCGRTSVGRVPFFNML